MNYIPINDVLSEPEKTTDVVVLVLTKGRKIFFKNDDTYCEFEHPPRKLNYKLHFLEVSLDTPTRKLRELTETNKLVFFNGYNRMLIFIDETCNAYAFAAVIQKINGILSILSSYQIQITIYSTLSTPMGKENFLFPLKSVYNIRQYVGGLFGGSEGDSYRKYKIDGKKYMTVPDLHNYENNSITCQSWFQIFVSNINKCGYGRLRQFSGTCYFTCVINTILFSYVFKRIVIEKMNEYIIQNPDARKYITLPLKNVQTCPNFSGKPYDSQLRYLYRIIYNLTCRQVKSFLPIMESSKEDILLPGSREFFASRSVHLGTKILRKLTRSNANLLEGGKALFVILNFLYFSKINFVIALGDSKEIVSRAIKYYKFNEKIEDEINFDEGRYIFNYCFYSKYYRRARQALLIPVTKITDIDIIVYIPAPDDPILLEIVSDVIKNYKLESATFDVKFGEMSDYLGTLFNKQEPVPQNLSHHAISTSFCDDVPKIFDSNFDIPLTMNWPSFKTIESDANDHIFRYQQNFYPYKTVEYFNCAYALYVNNSYRKNLKYRQQLCLNL